ncbi:ERF family protein [Borreliella valaisiana]|uniref:ERF family protein n=1 Tax=Borreliella valaisiana TaxID=62088 RepID=UPI003B219F52
MKEVTKNQENIQNNIQAEIKFLNDMDTLIMNLPGIEKNLVNKGYGYKYQNFNDIVEEVQNVIKKHNLDLMFRQFPTFTHDPYGRVHVIRTTFYSKSTGYRESFDTPMLTENLKWNNENGSKVANTVHQTFGAAITYVKRYALVACLNIKSEVDTDAAPIYNNYENENSTPNKQVSVNQKQKNDRYYNERKDNNSEQKQDITQEQKNNTIQNQKKDRFYYYSIFKDALSNIKNWVNSPTIKDDINSIIQKISFIQNIDPNNIDDIKKIEAALIKHFEQNIEFKSIKYWAELIKEYFKKNNRLKDLQYFENFMKDKNTDYGNSPCLFFSFLKEDKQFDYIFAA